MDKDFLGILDRFVGALEVYSSSYKKAVNFSVGNLASVQRSVKRDKLEIETLELEKEIAKVSLEGLKRELEAEKSVQSGAFHENAYK